MASDGTLLVGRLCQAAGAGKGFEIRAVPDLIFKIQPESDLAGFEMSNPAKAGAGLGNFFMK